MSWPPHHPYPHHNPHYPRYPPPVNPNPAPNPNQNNPAAQKKANDIATLRQCFPKMEETLVVDLYSQLGENFEKTYQAIAEMENLNTRMQQIQISPERKLSFMKLCFDKLDPSLIEAILKKYNWSVETALDDLLSLEEERCRIEAEARRQLDLQRMQQQEMENRRLFEAQQDMQRRALVAHYKSLFPRVDEGYITQILVQHNWDGQVAYNYLAPIEMNLQQQEQYDRQMREQEARNEAERWRQEQERRIQAMHASSLDSLIVGVQNWDQLVNKFEVAQDTGPVDQAMPPPPQINDEQAERAYYIDLAKEFYGIDQGLATQIFVDTHWDIRLALPKLEQHCKVHFQQKLKSQFPSLTPQEVDRAVAQYFPNENKAVQQLTTLSTLQLLEKALAQARSRLDDAIKRQNETKKSYENQQIKWNQQQAELVKLPQSERTFMESAYQMLFQKEQVFFNDLNKQHTEEIGKCQKEVTDAEAKLSEYKKKQAQINPQQPELSPEERLRKYEEKIASYKAARQNEKVQNVEVKKSMIADKLRKQIGEEKFASLVKVLGEAPGGVAAGWKGPSEKQATDKKPVVAPGAPLSPRKETTQPPAGGVRALPQFPLATSSAGTTGVPPSSSTLPPYPTSYPPAGYPPSSPGPASGSPLRQTGSVSSLPPPSASTVGSSPYPTGYPPVSGYPPNYPPSTTTPPSYPPSTSTNPPGYMPQYPPAYATTSAGYPGPGGFNPYLSNAPADPQSLYATRDEPPVFAEWFQKADTTRSGCITMQDAGFLKRSLLPDSVLAEVWRLASKGAPRLDRIQFRQAMHLIYLAQNGLPVSLEQETQLLATNRPMTPFMKFD